MSLFKDNYDEEFQRVGKSQSKKTLKVIGSLSVLALSGLLAFNSIHSYNEQ
jgi:hypothetical protein